MDFGQVEKRFRQLKAEFDAGKLPETEFKSQLEELMTQDEQGNWWMIGYETGLWHRNDGQEWVQTDPPRRSLEKSTSFVPDAPKPETQKGSPSKSKKLGSTQVRLFGFIGIVVFIGAALLFQPNKNTENTVKSNAVTGNTAVPTSIRDLYSTLGAQNTAVFKPTSTTTSPTSVVDAYNTLLSSTFAWPIVFHETFANNDAGWSIASGGGQFDSYDQTIADGKLIWGLQAKEDNVWRWMTSPFSIYSDFRLSVRCKFTNVPNNYGGLGLTFRERGDNFYQFVINSDRSFGVQMYNDGEWTALMDWTKTSKINLDKYNQLTVIAQGDEMDFFINNDYLATVTDGTLPLGKAGITVFSDKVNTEVVYEFDDFKLQEKP